MDVYYAARSRANLENACKALSEAYDLSPFKFDSHDTWRYAWSEGRGMRLNVTKASNDRTVETWMPGCLSGVNYQVILSAEAEPTGFASRLAEILGSEVVKCAASGEASDA